jgi:hypothetical protein
MRAGGDKLRQYLLCTLSESEAEVIDLCIIDDESLEADLLLAENDLFEAFLAGELSAADEEAFHANFLTSARRKELLRDAAFFEEFARRKLVEDGRPAVKRGR